MQVDKRRVNTIFFFNKPNKMNIKMRTAANWVFIWAIHWRIYLMCICDVVITQSCKLYRLCIPHHCILFKCSQLHRPSLDVAQWIILYTLHRDKQTIRWRWDTHLAGILLLSCAQIISLLFVLWYLYTV